MTLELFMGGLVILLVVAVVVVMMTTDRFVKEQPQMRGSNKSKRIASNSR